MRRRNSETVDEVLQQLLRGNKTLLYNWAKFRVKKGWYELMDKEVTDATTSLFFRQDTLHVQLSSAPLRMNMLFRREEIRQMLNQYAQLEVIREILFF